MFVAHLLEIIRDVPLAFPRLADLDKTKRRIYEGIATNPIRPGAGVIAIQILHVDYAALGAKEKRDSMCVEITTEEGTSIVVPLLIDVGE